MRKLRLLSCIICCFVLITGFTQKYTTSVADILLKDSGTQHFANGFTSIVTQILEDNNLRNFNEICIEGRKITLPATFMKVESKLNWAFPEEDATTKLESETEKSFAISDEPYSIFVTARNASEVKRYFKNCSIAKLKFIRTEYTINNIRFFANITFNDTEETVKEKMQKEKFKNIEIRNSNDYTILRFYKNDKKNFHDYIEYYFKDNQMNCVQVSTSTY